MNNNLNDEINIESHNNNIISDNFVNKIDY